MSIRQNKLKTYLAITAGAGCASSGANAAVIFYGVNSANDTNTDTFFNFSSNPKSGKSYTYNNITFLPTDGVFASANNIPFNDGSMDVGVGPGYFTSNNIDYYASYFSNFQNGASSGSANYANLDFDGDGLFEAVGQFNFDGQGNGFLVALATSNTGVTAADLIGNNDGVALSVTDGAAQIQAASVPEPSSLALIALGAAGLITRRNRKQIA